MMIMRVTVVVKLSEMLLILLTVVVEVVVKGMELGVAEKVIVVGVGVEV